MLVRCTNATLHTVDRAVVAWASGYDQDLSVKMNGQRWPSTRHAPGTPQGQDRDSLREGLDCNGLLTTGAKRLPA